METPASTPEDAPPPEGEEVPKLPMRHGIGVYKQDGNEYEGEWVMDKMQGHGMLPFGLVPRILCSHSGANTPRSRTLSRANCTAGQFKFMGGDIYDVRNAEFSAERCASSVFHRFSIRSHSRKWHDVVSYFC